MDVPGAGATQTNGGLAATQNGVTSIPGTFGIGGGPTSAGVAKTGGGGGYYGGAGSGHIDASGGGSSFISGYAGVNAITGESSTVATNRLYIIVENILCWVQCIKEQIAAMEWHQFIMNI